MSAAKRRLFFILIGMLAGLAAWPVAEATLYFQRHFPTYFTFSVVLGGMFGLIMGAINGGSDGIVLYSRRRMTMGMLGGALIGCAGGLLGFLLAQFLLLFLGEYFIHSIIAFDTVGLPIARAVGWACLGVFIGMIDGVRTRSLSRMRMGMLGGLLGGLAGGFLLEYLRLLLPIIALARLVGLLLLGGCIGLCYGFVEWRLSYGSLVLLNGKHKGQTFLLNQRSVLIGLSGKSDIVLRDYERVGADHAEVRFMDDELVLRPRNGKAVYANDEPVRAHILKFEDVIKIGTARLLFRFR